MTTPPPSPSKTNLSSTTTGTTKTLTKPLAKMSLKFAPKRLRQKTDDDTTIPQFSREYRSLATTKEKIQISQKACTGADQKLRKVDYARISTNDKDDELLKNNLAIETFIRKFKRHCIRYDIHELMTKFPKLDNNPIEENRFDLGNTINLIEKWDRIGDGADKEISVTEIGDTVEWIKGFATKESESYLEDMEWIHEHMLDSLDDDLAECVGYILDQDYGPGQRGGPLTFAIAMDQCINLSEEAIDSLKTSIESYDIKNVKGEDVSLV